MLKLISTYALVDIVSKLSAFLILPIVTDALTVDDFGLYRFSIEVTALIVTISSLGMVSSCARYNFESNVDKNKLYSTAIFLNVLLTIFLSFPLMFLLNNYGYTFNQSIVIFLTTISSALIAYPRTYFISNKYGKYFVKYVLTQVLSFLVFVFILDETHSVSLDSILMAILLSQIAGLVVGNIQLNKEINIKYSFFDIKAFNYSEFVIYTKNMYLTSIVSFVSINSDKFLVAFMFSKTELGLYSILVMFGMVIKTAGNAINLSIFPEYFRSREINDFDKLYSVIKFFLLVSPVLLFLFIHVIDLVLAYIGGEYIYVSQHLSPYFTLVLLSVIFQIYYHSFNYEKKTKLILKIEVVTSIFQVLILVLVSLYSSLSAVIYSYLLLTAIKFISLVYFVRKDVLFKRLMPYSVLALLLNLGVVFVV